MKFSVIVIVLELQIRGGIQNNINSTFILLLNENLCCELSLEPSWQDDSIEGSQHVL